jgi:hypothetical protein
MRRRNRAIEVSFQTGRSVIADSEGVLRFTDGAKEDVSVPAEIPVPAHLLQGSPYRGVAWKPSYTPQKRRRAYRVHVAQPPQFKNASKAVALEVLLPAPSWWQRVKTWFQCEPINAKKGT